MANLLGIDVGTTSMKAALFDENGVMLKSVTKDYTLITKGDRVELEAHKYRDMMFEALAEIRAEYSIDALSIDTQCETLIVADKDGEPLYNAIVWLDNRAAKEAEEIAQRFTLKEVFDVTGQPEITATWPASKLLWLRKNEPEVFGKIEKIFLLEDYLLYALTGEFVTEKTLQSSSLYLDIRNGKWWSEMLDFIGVSECKLPRLSDSGKVGTAIRSLIGFGVHDVAVIKPCVDVFDPHVLRASMGAFYKMRVHVYDTFEEYRAQHPDRALYPFMLDGAKTLTEVAPTAKPPFSLVFGNEQTGLPPHFATLGQSVFIPQSREIDSLNLAVAVSVGTFVFLHGSKAE